MTDKPDNIDRYNTHRTNPGNPKSRFMGQPIITDQIDRHGLSVVWQELEKVLQQQVPGAAVEFGCYAGTTSLFIRRQLDRFGQSPKRQFHVYDSFQGLPAKSAEDRNAASLDFQPGKLQVSKHDFIKNFRGASLQLPIIHRGWFDQLGAGDVPAQIAFAFLDGDFYGSILTSLQLVWPQMQPGGVVLIDDYGREALPGVRRAVTTFFGHEPAGLRLAANIAIIPRP